MSTSKPSSKKRKGKHKHIHTSSTLTLSLPTNTNTNTNTTTNTTSDPHLTNDYLKLQAHSEHHNTIPLESLMTVDQSILQGAADRYTMELLNDDTVLHAMKHQEERKHPEDHGNWHNSSSKREQPSEGAGDVKEGEKFTAAKPIEYSHQHYHHPTH